MSAGRQNRSVSFAGSAKAGAAPTQTAGQVKEVQDERIAWQALQIQRFLELPQVDPRQHTTLNQIYPVVRDQTIFLSEQFKDLD